MARSGSGAATGSRPRAGARAKRKGRGRMLVALGLLVFLAVATAVVWRRSAGIAEARVLRDLDRRRAQLEAQRAQLERDVRAASSRAHLAPVAEQRLGMHVPSDTQVIILPRPARPAAGSADAHR